MLKSLVSKKNALLLQKLQKSVLPIPKL